ncbi:acyltransferase family protein [Magnetospirillum molischianum]|uniref:Acyltransferase 3 n=1 Tax=Magnetospirillum molischianum DSM 120 TaxID=1150626 RepID=H8FQB8_MAGML|nr:acyltransferase [Magnetospirillum molischianum]CCG40556.1 Acyltransferase 3 [Magnetospirillum molischianum DSM 120]
MTRMSDPPRSVPLNRTDRQDGQRPPQLLALTSLRGLAAWWVVFYHFREHLWPLSGPWLMALWGGGYLAVDLFFILSGFVIHLNYASLFRRISAVSLREFASARLARIYPLYLVISVAFLANPLAIILFSSEKVIGERYDSSYYLFSLVLMHNWGFLPGPAWNIPSWSISVEAFAYCAFPAAAFVLVRYIRYPLDAVAVVVGLLAALAAFFYGVGVPSIGDGIARFGLERCVFEFLVGMALCRFYNLSGGIGPMVHWAALAGATVLFVLTAVTAVPDYLTLPAAFAMVVLALTVPGAPLSVILARPFLVYIGTISYSTYLCHYLVKDWVNFLLIKPGQPSLVAFGIYAVITLLASIALYHLVEKPGRKLVRRWARRTLPLPQ